MLQPGGGDNGPAPPRARRGPGSAGSGCAPPRAGGEDLPGRGRLGESTFGLFTSTRRLAAPLGSRAAGSTETAGVAKAEVLGGGWACGGGGPSASMPGAGDVSRCDFAEGAREASAPRFDIAVQIKLQAADRVKNRLRYHATVTVF